MSYLECPEFVELIDSQPEVLTDFLGTVEDSIQEINDSVEELKNNTELNTDAINALFRAMHSLKGNCEMVFLPAFVQLTHSLEDIVDDIRQGRKAFHPIVGDFIASVCTEIDYLIRQVGDKQQVTQQQYDECLALIKDVCETDDIKRPIVALKALHQLDGVTTPSAPEPEAKQAPIPPKEVSPVVKATPLVTAEELSDLDAMRKGIMPPAWQDSSSLGFLKFLSVQRDGLISPWSGRSEKELAFCLQLNELLDCPVDPSQLTAAVYMHDVGMAFVPHAVIDKSAKLDPVEFDTVKAHVFSASHLLTQIGGWDVAAEIVLQHHERYNGSGYPRGLKGDQIHPGAVFIGLADTFGALTASRAGRGRKKSLLGAMSEINASAGELFAPAYIDIFNEVVKDNFDLR